MRKIFSAFIVITFVSVFVSIAASVNELTNNVNQLIEVIDLMEVATIEAEEKAIKESLSFAPHGKSIYQLRGDAQTEAQRLINKLTDLYNLPHYELPTIKFKASLGISVAAETTGCFNRNGKLVNTFVISISEIIYLRNYEEFMHMVIPHEVAHVVTCLLGGYEKLDTESDTEAGHGEEWRKIMVDIGFKRPENYILHNFDMLPIYRFNIDLKQRLDKVFNRGDDEISEE